MSFDFLNPLMLAGLIGLALPIIAHLLSKRKYDVVYWGAMQFLRLRKNTRRRLRLEELMLLLLRMGLIALVVLAMARPWISGGFLVDYVRKLNRDVVFVIDGSYSMGWRGARRTPRTAAVVWARRFLEELQSGDTVALIDARNKPRLVVASPTSDFERVQEELDRLPEPAGTTNLVEAISQALQILSRTCNVVRDVIVLTDGQAVGWHSDDARLWAHVDDLLQQPAVKPRIWVVDVLANRKKASAVPLPAENFTVDRLTLSRELAVKGFPVTIRTRIRRSGGQGTVTRRVYFEVDGQRLTARTTAVRLSPNTAATVEFQYRFKATGGHVVSVVLDADELPGDDRAEAALFVVEALPAVLVDGDPQADPTRCETFFARAALTAGSNRSPWVRARTVPWEQFASTDLSNVEVAVLANVKRLTQEQLGALKDFVRRGGGVVIALGNQIDARFYNHTLLSPHDGLLPARLERQWNDKDVPLPAVYVSDASLQLPWLSRFRRTEGGGLTEARFASWWQVTPLSRLSSPETDDGSNPRQTKTSSRSNSSADLPESASSVSKPNVEIRLNTNDPLLLTFRNGRGWVALFTSSLDADWNTLPAKPDYVPFLHELIFRLSSGRTKHNVLPGVPLVAGLPKGLKPEQVVFVGPDGKLHEPQPAGNELDLKVRLNDTRLPGVYRLVRRSDVHTGTTATNTRHSGMVQRNRRRSIRSGRPGTQQDLAGLVPRSFGQVNRTLDYFVVDFDRRESDLRRLTEGQKKLLSGNGRLKFIATREQLRQEVFAEDSRTEIWHLLLWLFLVFLTLEVWMTRRLVKAGQAAVEDELEAVPVHTIRRTSTRG